MPKISFSSENKVSTFNDYPKLRFEQKGERARVVVLEPSPHMEWVHTLRAPVIINGEVVMESVKDKNGNTTQKPKMDFIGQHLCFGNAEKMSQKPYKDPANCPTCAAHNEHEDAIEAPRRRMALHIARYKTQPGSHKPQEPFQAELLAWVFGEKVFETLVSIAEEHGDLRQKDLLLECNSKMYQTVEVQVGGSAAWLANADNKKFVQRIYAENKSDDLSPLLGRKVTRQQAEEDISKVLTRHAQAFGGASEGAGRAPSVSETASAVGMEELLSGPSETVTGKSTDDTDIDLSTLGGSTPTEPAAGEPEAGTTTEEPKTEGGDVLDFDSLLSGL